MGLHEIMTWAKKVGLSLGCNVGPLSEVDRQYDLLVLAALRDRIRQDEAERLSRNHSRPLRSYPAHEDESLGQAILLPGLETDAELEDPRTAANAWPGASGIASKTGSERG